MSVNPDSQRRTRGATTLNFHKTDDSFGCGAKSKVSEPGGRKHSQLAVKTSAPEGACWLFARQFVIAHALSYWLVRLAPIARYGGHWEQARDAAELKGWLASVARLTPAQKADLLRVLSARDDQAAVEGLVESWLVQSLACPHYAGMRIVRNGSASGLQRYKCRACQRTFNALSKMPLARLRKKAKWLQRKRGLKAPLPCGQVGGTIRSRCHAWMCALNRVDAHDGRQASHEARRHAPPAR